MTAHKTRAFNVHWLGRVAYGEAHALQEALVEARVNGDVEDTILLLEHAPVLTLGRGASMTDVLVSEEVRIAKGVELFETGRGGQVTAHAPGQLVAYPIVDLKPERCDVRKYIRDLGEVMVRLCKEHGLDAAFLPEPADHIGVWLDVASPHAYAGTSIEKVGAIGVRLSRWVTMHGFALNVSPDLSVFDLIVPCGIREHGVTSFAKHGVQVESLEALVAPCAKHFADVFGATSKIVGAAETLELRNRFASGSA
jgi:lipoyl(octanoyl) transferase